MELSTRRRQVNLTLHKSMQKKLKTTIKEHSLHMRKYFIMCRRYLLTEKDIRLAKGTQEGTQNTCDLDTVC